MSGLNKRLRISISMAPAMATAAVPLLAVLLSGSAATKSVLASERVAYPLEKMEQSESHPSTVYTQSLDPAKYLGASELRIRVDQVGEPVSRPQRIEVSVRCHKDETYQVLATDLQVCKLMGVGVSQDRQVILSVLKYNPSSGKCERPDSLAIGRKIRCRAD